MIRQRHSLGALVCVLLLPTTVLAQQAASIAGMVRDTTGAVLPGVTVEAASPALIEKVRSAVTDGQGQYRIVDLRPGTYVVTFTLAGFNTSRREGIELTAGFTATINMELRVGALEETVTVTGASPLVDVQSARQQKSMPDELLTTLPTSSMTTTNIAALTPGVVANANIGGASGTYASNSAINITIHGKASGAKVNYDDMRAGHLESTGAAGVIMNPAAVEEWTVETGGGLAESSTSGITINMVPKEGGNAFRGALSGFYTNNGLQSDNLTDALRARGLQSVNNELYVFDATVAVGGPIKQDKLWFFTAHRVAGNKNQVAGVFFNKTHGTPFYTPDLERPAYRNELLQDYSGRVTWQVSQKNKVNFFLNIQHNCICRGRGEFQSPEAIYHWNFWPQGVPQVTWSSPITDKLLIEAGAGAHIFHWPAFPQEGVGPDNISIQELSTGFRYNADAAYGDPRWADRYTQRASISYITGAHAWKAGFQLEEGVRRNASYALGDLRYQFLNGLPNQITQFAPYVVNERMRADLGIFVQDRWTAKRLTLNLGLRFDYLNSYVPEQHLPANRWLPARDFAAVHDVPNWKDLNPRLGAAYDLFGNGRTALRASVGRYLNLQSVQLAAANNPVLTSVNMVNRTWNDADRNYVPDCDLMLPTANGECGAINNLNFGRNNPLATRYDDEVLRGFGVRDYLWDFGAEVQQQLSSRMSVTAGYYRNWYGNYLAGFQGNAVPIIDNLDVTPADFSPYCITAPLDPRLPGGGGYQVCGLYDVAPAQFGKVTNLVSPASRYGELTRVNDFVNVSVSTRIGAGIQLGGGVDTGRTVSDRCFVVDSPQELLYCRVETPWASQTQVKLFGSYPLPGDFIVSGTFQNLAGPNIIADYNVPNALIAPSLGRNLAACAPSAVTCNATAVVPLVAPQTLFEARRTQLDLRVSKIFRVGAQARLQANIDIYNALNGSSVYSVNNTYGPNWLRPVTNANAGGAIMDGRFIEFGGRLSF